MVDVSEGKGVSLTGIAVGMPGMGVAVGAAGEVGKGVSLGGIAMRAPVSTKAIIRLPKMMATETKAEMIPNDIWRKPLISGHPHWALYPGYLPPKARERCRWPRDPFRCPPKYAHRALPPAP